MDPFRKRKQRCLILLRCERNDGSLTWQKPDSNVCHLHDRNGLHVDRTLKAISVV